MGEKENDFLDYDYFTLYDFFNSFAKVRLVIVFYCLLSLFHLIFISSKIIILGSISKKAKNFLFCRKRNLLFLLDFIWLGFL